VDLNNVETTALSRRYGVVELPDIKIFHTGMPSDYQAGANVLDLLDVVRWNAGNTIHRPHSSRVVEVVSAAGLEKLLAQNRLVLVAFTTRWCSRCLTLSAEFDAASALLAAANPPVVLGSVNIDDPLNRQLTTRFAILSFPVGKIFHRGRFVGDFMGGSEAHEIVAEMLTIRDDLQLAEV